MRASAGEWTSPARARRQVAQQIGVVFGQRTQLWWDLPTIDSFEILAAMCDVAPADYRRFMDEFTDCSVWASS